MTTARLSPHPDSPAEAILEVVGDVQRTAAGGIVLSYVVLGDIVALRRSPRLASPERQDELWQSTCFEAFVTDGSGTAYCELNVAPSTAWAAYGFSAYRADMRALPMAAPDIGIEEDPYMLELTVSLAPAALTGLASDRPWRLNVTAVIEEVDGRKSFWALAHPAGKPDFHDPDCFVLELPAAG